MPGQITPPRYAPSLPTTSKVVAGAEIDDDEVAGGQRMRGDGVDEPVRADFGGVGEIDAEAEVDGGRADDLGFDVEEGAAQQAEFEHRGRNDRGDDRRRDARAVHAFKREELVQPHHIFVRGAPRVGGDAPAVEDALAIAQREDEVGVADIDREKHERRYSPNTSPA